jgi:hypothetical protein
MFSRTNYCRFPLPGSGFKTIIGLKDQMKKIILDLMKSDDEFLYYFLDIKRGTFLTDEQAKEQSRKQLLLEHEQKQKQVQNQPQNQINIILQGCTYNVRIA